MCHSLHIRLKCEILGYLKSLGSIIKNSSHKITPGCQLKSWFTFFQSSAALLDPANSSLLQAAAAAAVADRTSVPALLSDHFLHRNPFQQVGATCWCDAVSSSFMLCVCYQTVVHPMIPTLQHFAHSLANTSKDLYPALPGAASPPWTLEAASQLREKSAVEKRAVYRQNQLLNTRVELSGSNELRIPSTGSLHTRSLDRDPRLTQSPEQQSVQQERYHHAIHAQQTQPHSGWQSAKSSSVDVYHTHAQSPRTEYESSMSPMSAAPRSPTPNRLQVPSPHGAPMSQASGAYSPPRVTHSGSPSREHSPVRGGGTMSPQIKPKVTITTVTPQLPQDGGSVAMLVGMKLDVSNVWVGSVRGRVSTPVILHEHGLKIPFVHRDTGE